MNAILLNLRVLFFLAFLIPLGIQAQIPGVIYIQTENKQPFYVKMDNKLINSSATGYIILSKLNEDSNHLTIGFPENEWPELNVTVYIKEANAGYILINSVDRGWNMVGLQTKKTSVTGNELSSDQELEIISAGDEFARILAEVVNDPSITHAAVVKKKNESTVKKRIDKKPEVPVVSEVVKPEPEKQQNNGIEIAKTEIKKLMHDSTIEGLLIKYLEITNAVADTIKIFIPVTQAIKNATIEKQAEIYETVNTKEDTSKSGTRFIDMELQNPNLKIDSGTVRKDDFVITEKKSALNNMPVSKPETKIEALDSNKVMINSDCKKTASQNDFLELRKNMAAESSEKDMLIAANKQFNKTCFTTEQIKNLGVLFITEEEKYKFYVAAYPFVSDSQNFGTLENQLTENYYKTRFKAMLIH
jgi:Domain of unknown function (DUF4476)